MFPLLIAVFLSLQIISTTQTETLTIDRIVKLPPPSPPVDYTNNQMKVEYTLATDPGREYPKAGPKYPKCHMTIWITTERADPEQMSVYATEVTDTHCVFNVELGTTGGNTEFILALQNDLDVDQVTTDIKINIPVFHDSLDDVAMWVGNGLNDIALRVQDGCTSEFMYDGKPCIKDGASDPCYYVGVTKDLTNPISLCKKVTPTKSQAGFAVQADIDVCDETQIIADATNVFGNGAAPDTAEISYAKTGKADIGITRGTDDFEFIVYTKTGDDIDDPSVTVCVSTPCQVKRDTDDATYTIMMIGKANADPAVKDSTLHTLNDYELIGTGLSSTLLEIRWTKPTEYKKFKAHRDDGTPDGGLRFTDTIVTCEDAPVDKLSTDGVTHCFAYFTELDGTKKYDATITSMDDMDAPQDTNEVTLRTTEMPDAEMEEDMKMGLSSLTTKLNKGLRSLEVNACLHRVDSTDLSSYEAILINKIGQWKKVHGISQRFTNEFCFDKLNVDVHNFNISEDLTLVVVKRANDGITVLQSVETVMSV